MPRHAPHIADDHEPPELIRARRQKAKIEAYWRQRGMRVGVAISEIRVALNRCAGVEHRDYALISDTVNGLPRGALS